MINPQRHSGWWHPRSFITGGYDLDPDLLPQEAYLPKDQADAVDFVASLALQEIVDYDGCPNQQGMILEKAQEMFGYLFADQVALQIPDLPLAEAHSLLPYAGTNWDEIATKTTYPVTSQPLQGLTD